MLATLASLRKNRRLLSDLVRRDLRARYVGSSMGFFWSVIFPVINLCVYMFVFRFVLKMRWTDQQGDWEVALLMLAGIMVWQAFAESLHRMTNTLVDNSNLIQKVVFPSEVLPVYLTTSALVNMLIGLFVAIAGVAYVAYVRPRREPPVAVPVAFGAHEPGVASAAPELTKACGFRCASNAATTRYTERSVTDDAQPPWQQPAAGWAARTLRDAGHEDRVYAETGEWARVASKKGVMLEIDRWRGREGRAAAPPRDGVQALVAGDPERPIGLSVSLVALPVLLALQGTFMLGLGFLLAAFNLFVRDTFHLINVVLTAWMFATPIFYPARLVHDAGYGWLPAWNPMHWLITSYREVLVYGAWPAPALVLRFALVAAILLLLGVTFFMRQKPRFPDLL